MEPIRPDEILSKEEYERSRPDFRRRIMAIKSRRRVAVGDHATLHFENRETMLYQVHEMLRVEDSWAREGAIEDELAAYNPLVPAGDELEATLMLSYETPEERTEWLSRLVGLESHVWLVVGDSDPVPAEFDHAQVSPTRVSAVQYLRWPIDPQRAAGLRTEGTVVRVVIDHPEYRAQSVLSEDTRRELAGDLDPDGFATGG